MLQVQLVLNNICIVCLWMQAQLFLFKNAIFIYLVIHCLILITVFLIQTLIELFIYYLSIYFHFFFFFFYFFFILISFLCYKPQHFALICETICLQVNNEIYTVEEKNSIYKYLYAFVLILYRLYVKFVTFLYLHYVIKYV